MKIIIITALLISMLCAAITAEAAEPLVQEGKTWSHKVSVNNGHGEMSSTYMTMYFGSPKEMFGKTYFPVRCTGKDFDFAYIRQEGSKVYILADGTLHKSFSYAGDDGVLEFATGDEVLAYDFDAEPGDTYLSVSMGDMLPPGYINKWLEKVTVDKTDTVVVNGIERKRQFVHTSTLPDSEYTIIEGVGCDKGLFYVPEYGPLSIGGSGSTIVNISEMTDAEGNVLFTEADFDAPAYRPLVQEGKTWNYDLYIDTFGDTEHQTAALKFGTPEELFDEEYFPIVDKDEYKFGYMRQTGDKIHTLIDGCIINELYPYPSGGHILGTGEEALVCDFSASEGYKYLMSGYPKFLYDVTVIQADKILVNGIIRKRVVVACNDIKEDNREIIFVEGIGPNKGYLCQPQFMAMVHGTGSALVVLNNVTDAEGNVIFSAADFDAPAYSAGMPEVGFDMGRTQAKDDKKYDLNGREIRNPLPGTVYIQNGEKHVAK